MREIVSSILGPNFWNSAGGFILLMLMIALFITWFFSIFVRIGNHTRVGKRKRQAWGLAILFIPLVSWVFWEMFYWEERHNYRKEYEALYGRKPQSRRERKKIQKAIRNARLIDDRRFN